MSRKVNSDLSSQAAFTHSTPVLPFCTPAQVLFTSSLTTLLPFHNPQAPPNTIDNA